MVTDHGDTHYDWQVVLVHDQPFVMAAQCAAITDYGWSASCETWGP